MAQPKIFVSHSRKDNAFTERLVNDLRQAGVSAWADIVDMGAGNWQQRIDEELDKCEWFVLILTRDALASSWVQQEVYAANRLKNEGLIHDLIFIQAGPMDNLELPPTWGVFNVFDATADYASARDRTLKAVGMPLHVPSISSDHLSKRLADLGTEDAAMDFGRDKQKLERMVDRGHQATSDQLSEGVLESWVAARRARLADNITLLLQAMVHHIEDPAHPYLQNCRAYVMLRTADQRRKVCYQVRMNFDPDRSMAVGLTDGPSGEAWEEPRPVLLSLDDYRQYRQKDLAAQDMPPLRQKCIISVALKDYDSTAGDKSVDQLPLLGTLSVDSSTSIDDGTAFANFESFANLSNIVERWAEVISIYLAYK